MKKNSSREREPLLRWRLQLIEVEMKQLARERRHLQEKSEERPLTEWETRRMIELVDELFELLPELTRLSPKRVETDRYLPTTTLLAQLLAA